MESLEIEFPTEEQLNHWAHEAYDTLEDVWDIAEKTHTFATLATFLKEVPVQGVKRDEESCIQPSGWPYKRAKGKDHARSR